MSLEMVRTIAFDADDTLWVNEPIFVRTQDRCLEVLSHYLDAASFQKKLYETEVKNLRLFGYGIKGFVLSMIETVIQLTEGKVEGHDIQQLIDLGKEMLEHPVEVLDGVEETLKALQGHYDLMIITKGDLFDQESKIARSGLSGYFDRIEIVSEKDPATYQSLLDRHQLDPTTFLMVGNSLKSDVLPILDIGASAIHVPFNTTWQHEQVGAHRVNGYTYLELEQISQLPGVLSIR